MPALSLNTSLFCSDHFPKRDQSCWFSAIVFFFPAHLGLALLSAEFVWMVFKLQKQDQIYTCPWDSLKGGYQGSYFQ